MSRGTLEVRFKAQRIACSRPPDPITNAFIVVDYSSCPFHPCPFVLSTGSVFSLTQFRHSYTFPASAPPVRGQPTLTPILARKNRRLLFGTTAEPLSSGPAIDKHFDRPRES